MARGRAIAVSPVSARGPWLRPTAVATPDALRTPWEPRARCRSATEGLTRRSVRDILEKSWLFAIRSLRSSPTRMSMSH